MKIIYVTDIHDALKELRFLLSTTEADLYVLSGDILYKAFYDEDKIYDFVCLQEEFHNYIKQWPDYSYPYDLCAEILRFPEKFGSQELMDKALAYRSLFKKAAKTMKEKYQVIAEIIDKYSNAASYVLPGNYDIDLVHTALTDRNIHHKVVAHENLRLGGYGGAPIWTSGIPEKLAVRYHERREGGKLYSEPYDFFEETNPDILVIHNPVYGFFDRIPSMGRVGSAGLRDYVDAAEPMLVVSGHVHEDYGVLIKSNGTVFLNPSNFGGVDSPYGYQAGGAYAEIFVEGKTLQQVNLMRLIGQKSYNLLEVENVDGHLLRRSETNSEYCHLDLTGFIKDSSGTAL